MKRSLVRQGVDELARGFGMTRSGRRQADLFFADLMGLRPNPNPSRRYVEAKEDCGCHGNTARHVEAKEDCGCHGNTARQGETYEAWAESGPLIEGPLTESEWRSVILSLSRGEAQVGTPFTDNADTNALLMAAAIFCSRNAINLSGEDPLLCIRTDVTIADPRVRALVPHVTARGPIIDWTRVSRDARILYIMNLLVRTYSYPVNGAAGLVGNLLAESGALPQRVEGSAAATPMRARNFANQMTDFSADDIMNRSTTARVGPKLPGIGLAQWTSAGRRSGLFAHSFRGVTLGARVLFDMDAQVDYLVSELRSTGYARVQRVLTNPSVTVDAASDEVVYNFEIPGALLSGGAKLPRTDSRVVAVFNERRPLGRTAERLYSQSAGAAPRATP